MAHSGSLNAVDETLVQGEKRHLGSFGSKIFLFSGGIGVLSLIAAFAYGAMAGGGVKRFAFSYLLGFIYFLTLALGALFFVQIQLLTRASWSVVVRRIAEITGATMPVLAVLAIPIVLFAGHLYEWADPGVSPSALMLHKSAYLNLPFFSVRIVVYFLVWIALAFAFYGRSLKQDESGDANLTLSLQRLAAPGLVAFALTLTFASFDFLMSLDYAWFSTIFGVYVFSGAVVGFFSFLTVVSILLQHSGFLKRAITIEHYHDLGKLIFAFTVFWCYIAFSQFMLIWYGNIPEETAWFLRRTSGDWYWYSWALLAIHFVIPFLYLISRGIKRKKRLLIVGALWMLFAHFVDLYYLIIPEFDQASKSLMFSPMDVLCTIGIGGIFIASMVKIAGSNSIIPVKDPRLLDSLRFENV